MNKVQDKRVYHFSLALILLQINTEQIKKQKFHKAKRAKKTLRMLDIACSCMGTLGILLANIDVSLIKDYEFT